MKIERMAGGFRTMGLAASAGKEIVLAASGGEDPAEIEAYLVHAARELEKVGPAAERTVWYGFWPTVLVSAPEGFLVHERSFPGREVCVPGARFALKARALQQQEALAQGWGQVHETRCDQLAAVSEGFFEGLPAEGIRYPWRDPTGSGWIFTTDRYSGKVEDLQGHHLIHILEQRPELLRCLALPPGSFLRIARGKVDISFDVQASQAEPV